MRAHPPVLRELLYGVIGLALWASLVYRALDSFPAYAQPILIAGALAGCGLLVVFGRRLHRAARPDPNDQVAIERRDILGRALCASCGIGAIGVNLMGESGPLAPAGLLLIAIGTVGIGWFLGKLILGGPGVI